ncbi:MAG: type II secretion system protein GspG [Phycisphaeraceae bacterium]
MRVFVLCVVALLVVGCGESGDTGAGGSRGSREDHYYVDSTRKILEKLSESLEQFKKDKGRYPTEQEGLKELRKMTPNAAKQWSKPYTNNTMFVDAWGLSLVYWTIGDTGFELRSGGPDARGDTEDDIVVRK